MKAVELIRVNSAWKVTGNVHLLLHFNNAMICNFFIHYVIYHHFQVQTKSSHPTLATVTLHHANILHYKLMSLCNYQGATECAAAGTNEI